MMKSRRILMVEKSDSYTVLAPSDSFLGDKALSADSLNQSSLFSSFPKFCLFHKNTSKSSAADNIYGSPYALSGPLNPSVAIIIVVLLCAFFFIVFFSIYVRICASEEDGGENSRRGTGENGRMNRASQGLGKSIIETFPVFNFSLVKGLKQGKQILECAVCLSEFEDDETLRLLPKCGHAFHPDCIDMWLFSHTTCPLCRSSLVRESNIVEQSMRANVEGQPRQGTLHAAEQVVVDVSAENAVQSRVDHQGRRANEIMNPFDPGLLTIRTDQTRVLQQS